MAAFAVVCVGAATLDTIALVERRPGADERVEAVEMTTAGGGPAATAAVTLARLGLRVAFLGVIGTDDAGERILEGLAAEGVDVGEVVRDPAAPSGTSIVTVDATTGTRTIVTRAAPAPPATPLRGLAGQAEWLHVDQTGYAGLRHLSSSDDLPKISVDAGNPVPDLDLCGVTLYAPNRTALRARYPGLDVPAAVAAARDEGADLVAVTCGVDGSFAGYDDRLMCLPGFPVDVRSTLGAGDVFHGAVLAELVGGTAFPDAVRAANAAAALSCRGLDGRSRIPGPTELSRFLASTETTTDREIPYAPDQ